MLHNSQGNNTHFKAVEHFRRPIILQQTWHKVANSCFYQILCYAFPHAWHLDGTLALKAVWWAWRPWNSISLCWSLNQSEWTFSSHMQKRNKSNHLVIDILLPLAMTRLWHVGSIVAKPIRINEYWKMSSMFEMQCVQWAKLFLLN